MRPGPSRRTPNEVAAEDPGAVGVCLGHHDNHVVLPRVCYDVPDRLSIPKWSWNGTAALKSRHWGSVPARSVGGERRAGSSGRGWLPGSGWRAVAADDLPAGACHLARPVRVDGQLPAHLVQHHVMVPVTVNFQARQAGVPAVLAVHHMVRFAAGGGLGAAAGELAPLVPQGHQPAQVDRDVVGLALVRVLYLSAPARGYGFLYDTCASDPAPAADL